jgi:hypothetical protein
MTGKPTTHIAPNPDKVLMTATPAVAATLPVCVLEDIALYHDPECQCVYCKELRKREDALTNQAQGEKP